MNPLRLLATAACLCALPAAQAQEAAPQPTVLTCDHSDIWTVGNETHALCTGSVTLTGTDLRILCDRLEMTAENIGDKTSTIPTLDKFNYLLAIGHVRIVQGDREATCGRAEVLPRDNKIVLTQEPVVIDRGTGWTEAGETITVLRGERRVIVEKPRMTGPPVKDLGFNQEEATPRGAAAPAAPAK